MGLSGLLERIAGVLRKSDWDPAGGGTDDAYVCIKCGEGYDRPRNACSDCGGQFVVPTDDE